MRNSNRPALHCDYDFTKDIQNKSLTAVLVETGTMPVPTKSQNPTVCGWGGPFHSYLTHS